MKVHTASSVEDINRCFPAFHELRPHLEEREFAERVLRQMQADGYVLVYGLESAAVVTTAGYRIAEYLAWGRTFYVDDLITIASARRRGFGGQMLDWLIERARELRCDQFHLDSGVHRHDAHRLYVSRRMQIGSHHFSLDLRSPVACSMEDRR